MNNLKRTVFWKRFSSHGPDPSAYFRRSSNSSQVTLSNNESDYPFPDSYWDSECHAQPSPCPDYETSDKTFYSLGRRRRSFRSSKVSHLSDPEKNQMSRSQKRNKKRHKVSDSESDSSENSSGSDKILNEKHPKMYKKDDRKICKQEKKSFNVPSSKRKTTDDRKIEQLLYSSSSSEDIISSPAIPKVKKSILRKKDRKEKSGSGSCSLNWTLRNNPKPPDDELMLKITINDLKSVIKENVMAAVKQTIDAKVEEARDIKHVRCISPDIPTTDTEASNTSGDALLPRILKKQGLSSAFQQVAPRKIGLMSRCVPYSSSSSDSTTQSMNSYISTLNSITTRPPLLNEQMRRRGSLAESTFLQHPEKHWQNGEQLLMQTPALRGALPLNARHDFVDDLYSENSGVQRVPQRNESSGSTTLSRYHMNHEPHNDLMQGKRRNSLGVFSLDSQSSLNFPIEQINYNINAMNPEVIAPSKLSRKRESILTLDRQPSINSTSHRSSIQYPLGTCLNSGPLIETAPIDQQANLLRRASIISTQGTLPVMCVTDSQTLVDAVTPIALPVQEQNLTKVPRATSDLSTVVEESVYSREDKEETNAADPTLTRGIPTTELLKRSKEKKKKERAVRTLKICVVLTGILVVLNGLGVLGLGVLNMIDGDAQMYAAVSRTSPGNKSFQYYCYGMCLVGVFVSLVWFIGCLGAMKVNICLLQAFISCLVFVIVLKLALVVIVLISKDQVTSIPLMTAVMDNVGTNLFAHLKKSVKEYYIGNSDIGKAWDVLQIRAECCGCESHEDYLYSAWRNSTADKRTKMPDSCCVLAVKDPANPQPTNRLLCQTMTAGFWHKTGCYEVLLEWYHRSSVMALAVILSLVCLEMVCIIFAIRLCKKLTAISKEGEK